MKNLTTLLLALAIALVPALTHARSAKLEPAQRVALVAPAGKTLDEAAVKAAIVAAAAGRKWQVAEDAPGQMTLRILVRGKHTVVVRVAYDAGGFVIDYVSSVNMNHKVRGNGDTYLHPNYQAWVDALAHDISLRINAP